MYYENPKLTTIARKIFCEEKAKYPQAIVFVQVGDYYESYHADAMAAKKLFRCGTISAGCVSIHGRMFGLPTKDIGKFVTETTAGAYNDIIVINNPLKPIES